MTAILFRIVSYACMSLAHSWPPRRPVPQSASPLPRDDRLRSGQHAVEAAAGTRHTRTVKSPAYGGLTPRGNSDGRSHNGLPEAVGRRVVSSSSRHSHLLPRKTLPSRQSSARQIPSHQGVESECHPALGVHEDGRVTHTPRHPPHPHPPIMEANAKHQLNSLFIKRGWLVPHKERKVSHARMPPMSHPTRMF